MNREEILNAAKSCVCGDRDHDYGVPENNFRTIAKLWEAYFGNSYVRIEPRDVAAMLALLKIARISAGKKVDNWVDLAGYAACGGEIDGEETPKEVAKPAGKEGVDKVAIYEKLVRYRQERGLGCFTPLANATNGQLSAEEIRVMYNAEEKLPLQKWKALGEALDKMEVES